MIGVLGLGLIGLGKSSGGKIGIGVGKNGSTGDLSGGGKQFAQPSPLSVILPSKDDIIVIPHVITKLLVF
jgi:hypothetical protein